MKTARAVTSIAIDWISAGTAIIIVPIIVRVTGILTDARNIAIIVTIHRRHPISIGAIKMKINIALIAAVARMTVTLQKHHAAVAVITPTYIIITSQYTGLAATIDIHMIENTHPSIVSTAAGIETATGTATGNVLVNKILPVDGVPTTMMIRMYMNGIVTVTVCVAADTMIIPTIMVHPMHMVVMIRIWIATGVTALIAVMITGTADINLKPTLPREIDIARMMITIDGIDIQVTLDQDLVHRLPHPQVTDAILLHPLVAVFVGCMTLPSIVTLDRELNLLLLQSRLPPMLLLYNYTWTHRREKQSTRWRSKEDRAITLHHSKTPTQEYLHHQPLWKELLRSMVFHTRLATGTLPTQRRIN